MGNEAALSAFGAKDLFIHSGIFRWHQCLQRQTGAAVPPARSVFAMAQCLRALPRSWVAKTGSVEDLDLLILELLDRHRDAYAEQPLPPEVQTWGPRDVDWWQPRDLLGQLIAVECGPTMLRNARRRMTERGVRVDYTELHDLAAMFANDYLPSAMRWFNPARGEGKEGAWVTTVFFRYAIPRVLNTARCRVSFDEAFVEADLAVDPEVASEQLQRKVLLDRVASELDALSEPRRTALALYFGLDDRENTLGLVAKAMGHSVQFVRMAIISGLGAMALRLSLGHGACSVQQCRQAQAISQAMRALELGAVHLLVGQHVGEVQVGDVCEHKHGRSPLVVVLMCPPATPTLEANRVYP